jgi:hypothetical protein
MNFYELNNKELLDVMGGFNWAIFIIPAWEFTIGFTEGFADAARGTLMK